MTGVVKTRFTDPSCLQKRFPGAVVHSRVDRTANDRGEHVTVVLPHRAGGKPLSRLGGSMSFQRRDERNRDRDRSATCVGLRRTENEPTADPSRATARAGVSAVAVAPMTVRAALQRSSHSEGASLEIDVFPQQAERLALPQAERKCNGPACGVAGAGRCVDDLLRLILRQRLHFDSDDARRLDEGTDVPRNALAGRSYLQGTRQHAVGLQD
ncbi:hypothetical protein [Jatrophihabitans sp.]|uniref:hypothetical protein n=1 Tax=Jatrophihabitans sp. TaxID=1932789 RepID=UPI0030C73F50